jgi:hypothetical protein
MATGDDKEPLDVETVVERLNGALPLQFRSAVAYTVAAGTVTGFPTRRSARSSGRSPLPSSRTRGSPSFGAAGRGFG